MKTCAQYHHGFKGLLVFLAKAQTCWMFHYNFESKGLKQMKHGLYILFGTKLFKKKQFTLAKSYF